MLVESGKIKRKQNKQQRSWKYHESFSSAVSIGDNISAKRNKVFRVFCWSGDTRIWTGEKGFAVPRLTTRPCRQGNRNKKKTKIPPPFFFLTKLLFFCTCILNPFPKRNPSFFGLDLSLWLILYSMSKHALSEFFLLSIERKNKMWIFSHKSRNSGQIGTVNYWLKIHERFSNLNLNLNLKLYFPNDIRKLKWISNYPVLILFNKKKPSPFQL